ncbi:hypothetical protein [Acetobacterium bakii]|uniref:Uncharacterized protein n=1 Tax=Acetobacterium bakii TaxID=52689 RepID=A0A0L6TVR4_9FIRM|nr:hypothetical protein [Acetobacterium bakii]KNZ40343.1 hypothetical protein AKG39_18310 [Acetobacterium bakii]
MNKDMRKELKIGILLFAIFNLINLFAHDIVPELPVLHFFLGGLAALAFMEIIIGILPEPTYLKLKQFKKNLRPFKK